MHSLATHRAIAAESQPVTVRFRAAVGDRPFRCGESYALGTDAMQMTPADFRFYVSNISLIDAQGTAVPLSLEQDGKWQHQSVALLDFEDKSASCTNGTTETRDRITGTVPPGDYRQIRFTLGVPFDLNHADATLAPSPLNLTSMWWNWRGGYKFLRVDLTSAAMPHGAGTRQRPTHGHGTGRSNPGHSSHGEQTVQGFSIHLGSTACQAGSTIERPTRCDNPNRAEVTLNFNAADVITADLAALVASTNLTTNHPNSPAGCMASPDDMDCKGIMHSVGLPFNGQASSGQTFFRVE